ncbi:hypothetical protein K458DRAFT_456063 [Lentithecium fluviatile CBS 122367]|uniref:Uncharacterized protein n=1 Tax=Lentithecium fluviatile CBS 122367 TaxID=1168545 RepID=A0A6G1IW75_9PLEO|nr:hypothetical protein K458DRAFT_456063 [Lentithecium fluviatile CBS 122367]
MPMLYREGEKVFLRLQEEILKQSSDMSICMWLYPSEDRPPAFWGLLAKTPRYFAAMGTVCEMGRPYPADRYLTNRGIVVRQRGGFGWGHQGYRVLLLEHGFLGAVSAGILLQRVAWDIAVRVNPERMTYQVPMASV